MKPSSHLLAVLLIAHLTSFVFAKDPPAGTTTRPATFVANLAAGKKQAIVTMGTSLTEARHSAWVAGLKTVLDNRFPGLATVENLAKSGSSTAVPAKECGLDVVKAVVAAKPDTVFIEFGMNDSYLPYKISQEQSVANLNSIIDTIVKANPKTEVILQTMNCCKDHSEDNPSHDRAINRPNLQDYYQIYRDVALKRNLLLIDQDSQWLRVLKDTPDRFDQLVPDGVHPNGKGAKEIILPTLEKAVGLSS